MSYNNCATVTVVNYPVETEEVKLCPTCKTIYRDDEDMFCTKDGAKLEPHKIHSRVKDIIKRFRDYSDEVAFAIDDKGKTENPSSSAGAIPDILKKFSSNYPEALFQVDIDWDQGFGDPPSRYYIQNGKKQDCKTKVIFDEFDPTKLK